MTNPQHSHYSINLVMCFFQKMLFKPLFIQFSNAGVFPRVGWGYALRLYFS